MPKKKYKLDLNLNLTDLKTWQAAELVALENIQNELNNVNIDAAKHAELLKHYYITYGIITAFQIIIEGVN